MDKKYLFFDIDGTLAVGRPGDQYVPDSTREALERLRKVGHFLAIATGRAQALAVDYMHELGFHSMVSDGGYGVTIDDEFLGVRPLDHNACVALIDECREKGYPWSIQVENSDTRFTPDGRFEEFTRDIYQKTRVVPGLEPRDYPEIYKVNVACYEPDERRLKTLPALPWCRYQKEYIFVEPADKAYGIRQILAHEGGAPADVVVFGDGINDLSMFTGEWTGVAMGNAAPELKAVADLVTAPAGEDGIFRACEQLGLFEPVER